MEPKEFRIGNWVNITHWDKTVEPKQIEWFDLQHAFKLDDVRHEVEWKALLPIPLDESWLIRCKQFTRWDYFGDENYGGYFSLWGPWKLMVRHFKSGFVFSIVTIDRKRMCYRLVKEIDLKANHVHELQNFIWSARQEELVFNP